MKRLQAGVIGCGAIAHHCHIPGYINNKFSDLVAVADPSKENLKTAMEKFSIPNGYASIEEMFEKHELDCVSIGSPNRFHAEHAILALQKGCHVLCEKPLCLTIKETQAIKRAADKAGTVFMTAFTNRLYRGNQKAKKLIEQGKIGKPYMIRIRFAHQGPMSGWAMSDWFYRPEAAGGGALFDMGIHAIDLASHYFGPIKKVNAMVATLEKEIDLDDNAIMQFAFESGALGYVEVGWTSKQGFFGVEIYGSEASIVIDYLGHAAIYTGKTTPSGERKVRARVFEKTPCVGGWDVEVDYFIQHIRKNQQPDMGLEAGIHSLKVALGAYDSAKKGRTVTV